MAEFVYVLLLWICSALFFSSRWAFDYFGLSCFEQIPFHLKVSLEGTNTEFIFDWFKMCGIKSILQTIILGFCLHFSQHPDRWIFLLCILLIIGAGSQVHFFEWIINQFRKTQIYEKYFVDSHKVELEFPKQKRNLIVLYVESLETTYTSKENGGDYASNLIPELSKLAQDNINFSHQDKLGGAHIVAGTGWTTGGLVATNTGVGLTVPLLSKRYKEDTPFLAHTLALGDILTNRAKKELPENYHVFWGYEDKKLFAFAKKEISKLAQQEKPFNFQCLTVDTHHPKGYLDENAKEIYPERLSNIIRPL